MKMTEPVTRPMMLLVCITLCLIANPSCHANNEQVYAQCIACHSFGYSRTGPDHCGLFGRIAGTLKGFEFTQAMQNSDIIWTVQSLDEFLSAPLQMVPGTSMGFIGIANNEQRYNLIQYIRSKQNSEDCK